MFTLIAITEICLRIWSVSLYFTGDREDPHRVAESCCFSHLENSELKVFGVKSTSWAILLGRC